MMRPSDVTATKILSDAHVEQLRGTAFPRQRLGAHKRLPRAN
jgi:hypothetical protein